MELFWYLIFFSFGASVGSFLNVILDRYNTGLSFWGGKSFCFSCNYKLQKKDMFPIFSFLFLKGRCRNCGSRIPNESLFVELIMGILSVLLVYKISLFFSYISLSLVISYLLLVSIFGVIVLISFYDLRHMIIPNSFLIAFFFLSFLYTLILDAEYLLLIGNTISGIVLALPFLLIFILSKGRWMGFGDIKYIAVLGFFLGLVNGSSAIIIAFWVGAILSILLILVPKVLSILGLSNIRNRFKMNSAIPFGPFLSLGITLSFYLNVDILQIQILKELLFEIF